jgi:hypothetical protein
MLQVFQQGGESRDVPGGPARCLAGGLLIQAWQ